ncbi:helix-turn-helix domain-containing protein [Pseudonocardia sp.]|uniref:GlxA family transcriptional regulator n=1 Tax=Pseudonocardia sp. TaxID=60912 RepID=UPI0026259F12|nr:helix-turn-helix domain-containing protein [Pseudonocardia sp.]
MPVFVAVLAVEDVVPFNLGIPGQVFGAPASVLGDRYQHSVCAPGGRVRTSGGLVLQTEHGLDLLQRADLIILPGTDPITTEVPDEVLDSLRAAHGRGARLASLCTGAFILAATGLLDGRQAATHWFYAPELAARHPAIEVRPEVLFIDDGQLLTSAGLAAGIDLCLHIVRADHGAEVANRCARYLVAAPHRPGGQSQYIERPVSPALLNPLAATQTWLLDHLDRDVTINQMAGHAGMSRRSFTRRFRVETGTTPLQWLLDQRIMLARRLLETTDRSVDQVAEECGMRTGPMLRRHFRAVTGTTPTAYRQTFSHHGATPQA